MIDLQEARDNARKLAAIGDPIRMYIIVHLAGQPLNVGQLAAHLGIPKVNMSHHLGVLRSAGLVDDTRSGRNIVYSLRSDIYTASEMTDDLGSLRIGTWTLFVARNHMTDGQSSFGHRAKDWTPSTVKK